MTLTQLKYIVEVARSQTISKAAEKLYISQPSLTSAIRELENEFQITIFQRTNKGVILTKEGEEFLGYARQVLMQTHLMEERYALAMPVRHSFCVSTQHYSFAVKAFVDMAKQFDMSKYEFAMRETRTAEVIRDVSTMKSEIGVLYLSDFNRKSLEKLLRTAGLEFHPLAQCRAYVYLWKGHPLAGQAAISFDQLAEYPCLAFEQGDNSAFYLAEEILSTNEYPKIIRANDRATMLNLMVGLNGYTLCSGIISQELNGDDFAAIPFQDDEENQNSVMEIGYVVRKNTFLSKMGELYIEALKESLKNSDSKDTQL